MSAMNACHSCRKPLTVARGLGRREVCPWCGADLHCCLNCKFYDPAVSKQCRETAAELVKEKAKANFCDYFVFAVTECAQSDAETARRALDDLFRK